MLAIRLSRVGKKNSPSFRVVAMDKRKSAKGRALEVLGSVNPRSKEINLKSERILYWMGVGAQPSDRVYNILVSKNIIKGPKRTKKISKSKKAEEAVEEPKQEAAKEKVGEPTQPAEAAESAPVSDGTKDEVETGKMEDEKTEEQSAAEPAEKLKENTEDKKEEKASTEDKPEKAEAKKEPKESKGKQLEEK